jgi:hypothetical protein
VRTRKTHTLHAELTAPETVAALGWQAAARVQEGYEGPRSTVTQQRRLLAITFAHPVMPKRGIHSQGTAKVSFDWDPLEERRGGVLT